MNVETTTPEFVRFHCGREGLPYYAHPDLITAFEVAHTLGRPLLLTGEPGCGKTDFAWAAAGALASRVHACYVHSDARARDLLYNYDGLHRLADVQAAGVDEEAKLRARNPAKYIELKELGLAMLDAADSERPLPVALLDEIDKAPRDLPNDLLRELDRGGFEISELTDTPDTLDTRNRQGITLRSTMARGTDAGHSPRKPFVVITSNTERQLPDPFLRRCIFYHLEFPHQSALTRILADHFDHLHSHGRLTTSPPTADQRGAIARIFLALRDQPRLVKKPATSELLDWSHALLNPKLGGALATVVAQARIPGSIPWPDVPALCCLLKLRDDRIRLRVSHAP